MSALIALRAVLWLLTAGCAAYLTVAFIAVVGLRRSSNNGADFDGDVTVLRPLCGAEPALRACLDSLLSQDVDDARVRFVFGVAAPDDPALTVAHEAAAAHPTRRVDFVVDATVHGCNPKVSNLINMSARGLDALVVVTDSDVLLPPGSLAALLRAAAPSRVGAVTALSRGRPSTPRSAPQWMACLYLDGWFLPTAALHARLGGNSVCYGQLTAVKRCVLPGASFRCLRNALADDTELGHLTRRAGLEIAFAPHVVEICTSELSLAELFTHELRWARTIRALQPRGYLASVFMHPGPLPMFVPLLHHSVFAWVPLILLALMRWSLVLTVHARFGRARDIPPVDPLTLWLRDQLYFAIWLSGFFGRTIRWRHHLLRVGPAATVHLAGREGGFGRLQRWRALL